MRGLMRGDYEEIRPGPDGLSSTAELAIQSRYNLAEGMNSYIGHVAVYSRSCT